MNGFSYLCIWQDFNYSSYGLVIVTRPQKKMKANYECLPKENIYVPMLSRLCRGGGNSPLDSIGSQIKSFFLGMGSLF